MQLDGRLHRNPLAFVNQRPMVAMRRTSNEVAVSIGEDWQALHEIANMLMISTSVVGIMWGPFVM